MVDTRIVVTRVIPETAIRQGTSDDKRQMIQEIQRQMARDCVEIVMDKMTFVEERNEATREVRFAGVVHIASEKERIDLARQSMPSGSSIAEPPYAPNIFSAKMWEDLKKKEPSVFEAMMKDVQLNINPPLTQTATGVSMQVEETSRLMSEKMAKLAEHFSPEKLHKMLIGEPFAVGSASPLGRAPELLKEQVERRARQTNLEGAWAGVHYCLTEIGETIMSKNFWESGNQFDGEGEQIRTLPKINVLIDGDIVAYRCAATCDGRHYTVDGQRFGYKKDAVAYADKKGIPNVEIELHYDPEPVDTALHNINVTMENIKNYYIYDRKCNPQLKIFLSGSTNFRYDVYPEYKKSRKNQRKPHWIAECKEHMVKQFSAFQFEGFEADDLIGMTVEALRGTVKAGDPPLSIASCDKDFTQLGGPAVEQYDWTTNKLWQVTEHEALHYFYKQLLTGDKSDDIPGLPKVGPQTALKVLAGCEEERDMYNAVVLEYKNRLDISTEDAEDAVNLRGKLLWLLRNENELWTPPPPRKQKNE